MEINNQRAVLYSSQRNVVIDKLKTNGVHYAKMAYIRQKYQSVSAVFVGAYSWFAQAAPAIVSKPAEAESGIWVFADAGLLERDNESTILRLNVPLDEVVFFKMSDWNKVLNCRYMGLDEKEEQTFADEAHRFGVHNMADICTTGFYPQLKRELTKSWERLFRFDEDIKAGKPFNEMDLQGAVWQLKEEWVEE